MIRFFISWYICSWKNDVISPRNKGSWQVMAGKSIYYMMWYDILLRNQDSDNEIFHCSVSWRNAINSNLLYHVTASYVLYLFKPDEKLSVKKYHQTYNNIYRTDICVLQLQNSIYVMLAVSCVKFYLFEVCKLHKPKHNYCMI